MATEWRRLVPKELREPQLLWKICESEGKDLIIFTYPVWVGCISKLCGSPLATLSGLFQSAIEVVVAERFHDLATTSFDQSMCPEKKSRILRKKPQKNVGNCFSSNQTCLIDQSTSFLGYILISNWQLLWISKCSEYCYDETQLVYVRMFISRKNI